MKKIIVFIMLLISISYAHGQEKKRVAVAPATGNAEVGVQNALTEALFEAVANSEKYILLERANFDQIKKELSLQQSGFVDDEQIVELGRLAGAELVLISSINIVNNNCLINYRLVDILTGTVLNRAKKTANFGTILEVINAISVEPLFADNNNDKTSPQNLCGCEVQREDFGEKALSRKEIKKVEPQGWRLPTLNELKCMCKNKEKIGGFNYGVYYSSEIKDGNPIGIRFNSCFETGIIGNASIRYVR
ncbi:MAG: penicillin-binding protein activator LpoB [Bacteroidales bacterium]|jgi:hypothetical protein|nr:penicillin-binding protein activator LpoB [Bacteroidales bacterium]